MTAGNTTLVDQGYSLHTSPAYIPQEPKPLWSPSTYQPIQLDITFLLCYTSFTRHLRLKMMRELREQWYIGLVSAAPAKSPLHGRHLCRVSKSSGNKPHRYKNPGCAASQSFYHAICPPPPLQAEYFLLCVLHSYAYPGRGKPICRLTCSGISRLISSG